MPLVALWFSLCTGEKVGDESWKQVGNERMRAGEESLLWAGLGKRVGDESWVKFLTKCMESKITQGGGESRMSREVTRKAISLPYFQVLSV